MNEDWERACWLLAGLLLGSFFAEIRNWIARRRSRFESVVERYVQEVGNLDDPDIRLVAMRRAGVASLTEKNFGKFVTEVMARGCIHPYQGTTIHGIVKDEKIPEFIHIATQKRIPLANNEALLDYFIELLDDDLPDYFQSGRKVSST